ncbi:hypothetical protein ACJMK2_038210 [Sinanodonta woodiana]|uniref:Peptidase M12B domain-containing protein n=1 Tax=Sinanodonta woodiana TaxID=1069815 RepID=A0ABD3WR97_SINWO
MAFHTYCNILILILFYLLFSLKRKKDFPHIQSEVEPDPGTDRINVDNYITDLANWTSTNGHLSDHIMLFTKYDIYGAYPDAILNGYSYTRSVCDNCYKASIVKTSDYMLTVLTAAHELGHNLGADHDGEGEGLACRADDNFLMSPTAHLFQESKRYFRNPWVFSNCSVESFKRTLPGKTCLTNVGEFYDGDEFWTFMQALPGEVFSSNEQCEFALGHGSRFCGVCTFFVNVFV